MLRKRIDGIDCFAITAKGCKWLADQLKKDVSLFKSTTEALRPTKAGTLSIRHRLAADFVALFAKRELVKRGNKLGTIKFASERSCSQVSYEIMRKRFGKRPDGYFYRAGSGRSVVLEVERSRRNSEGWSGLMLAMRNFSNHGDPAEFHAAGWLFIVEPDCKTDIIRNITKEFGYDKFQHFTIGDAHMIFFDTGVSGSESLAKYPALCSGPAVALVLPMNINGPVMDWVPSLSKTTVIPYFSLNVLDGKVPDANTQLAEIVENNLSESKFVKLINQVFQT